VSVHPGLRFLQISVHVPGTVFRYGRDRSCLISDCRPKEVFMVIKQPYSKPMLVALGDVRSFTLGGSKYDTADMGRYYN
jgi:hypothetical protein